MPHGHVVTRWRKFSRDNTLGAMAAEQELRSQIERDQLPRPPWVLTLLEKFTTFHSWETREESEGVGRGNGGRGMQCRSRGKIKKLIKNLPSRPKIEMLTEFYPNMVVDWLFSSLYGQKYCVVPSFNRQILVEHRPIFPLEVIEQSNPLPTLTLLEVQPNSQNN